MFKKLIRQRDLPALIIIFLIPFLFFLGGFLKNQIIWGFDTLKIVYPLLAVLDESFKSFHLPLWSPDIYFGFPIGADGQIPWFYPFSVVHIFLPLNTTILILSFIHVFLAGAFTYFFARTINLNRFAAVFAGIVFMFNGFIVAHMQYLSHIYAYAYLPLILLLVELAITKKENLFFLLAGASFGLQLLSGHPNIPIMTIIYVVMYLFLRDGIKKSHLFVSIPLLVGIALLVALPYVLYSLRLIPLSIRGGGVDFVDATNSSFSLFDFITFVFPNFFFDKINNSWVYTTTWHFWSYWGQIETTGYVGIMTLFFIPFAFLKKTRQMAWLFFFLLLISIVLALGKNTPLYSQLLHIPVFNGLRAPGRFLYLVDFSLAILGGFGLTSLFGTEKIKKLQANIAVVLVGCLVFILVGIGYLFTKSYPDQLYDFIRQDYSKLGFVTNMDNVFSLQQMILNSFREQTKLGLILVTASLAIILLIQRGFKDIFIKSIILILLISDLFLFADKVNLWSNFNELLNQNDPVINQLKNELSPDTGRIYTFGNSWNGLIPDQLMPYHIPEANGFVSLPLKRFEDWQKEAEKEWYEGKSDLFKIGSIKYVYDRNTLIPIDNPLPRAYVTNSFVVTRNKLESFDVLTNLSDINTAVVESGDQFFPSKGVAPAISNAEIKVYQPNYVKILADTMDTGLLVLTDTNFPGWEVFVNNKKKEIYQTNYLFRGVVVPKGLNMVEFRYRPTFFNESLIISLGTCLVIVFLVLRKLKINL